MMIGKYVAPQEATPEQLVWRDQGKYKRITVTKDERTRLGAYPVHLYNDIVFAYLGPIERIPPFPIYDSYYDPRITGLIVAVVAAIVTVVWGPRTLAWYRYA